MLNHPHERVTCERGACSNSRSSPVRTGLYLSPSAFTRRCPRLAHFKHPVLLRALCVSAVNSPVFGGDFADAVVSYQPAPGQFINNPLFNDPSRALGPPVGGGTISADNTKLVSLGGFGGSIVLRFFQPVLDDPCNPFGLDFIVFGNAVWVSGNPNRRFAEGTIIEIARDANANGIADDPWFVIPGSHIANTPPSATPVNAAQSQSWDDTATTPTPPANIAWYPSAMFYPGRPSIYSTSTFRLPALFETQVLQNPNGSAATREGVWGYADCSPTLLLGDTNADNVVDAPALAAAEFYTVPDNPFAVGVTPGSGGGDAFDIAWAVDPVSGAPANLGVFDFIRISTGVSFVAGVLGEISSEVSAVSDARPRELFFDVNSDASTNAEDAYAWESLAAGANPAADLDGDGTIGARDRALLLRCIRRAERGDISTP